ncbi:BTAD domain-containing putative transcriptional regulator [Streptomyces griseorubiginosus]|uniref:BTAD domain-containing putative transcriptional regulator n=1 Tax=Streptomyces griseorubiginosus TaxID=67304 RepID=UPI00215A9162|nr:BTAD domain-containing putative transcriptional regulator [Streptomyces griseorubiginosus]
MLRIRVLGPLGAEVAGAPVELGTPRQRAVLALLVAARGAVVSVDRMADQLWRGRPPARATVSLQTYVSNLRRLLEPERPPRAPAAVLVSSPPGYALRLPEDAVDAWRFGARVERARRAPAAQVRESLTEALGWWRGPAFQEHADEAWAVPEVARLGSLRAEARELAVAAGLFTGHVAEVAPAAEAMVRERPLREEGWRLLALAHWAADRRSDALTALRRARRTLRDELGCDLSPALAELERAILTERVDVLRAAVPERGPAGAERLWGAGGSTPAGSAPGGVSAGSAPGPSQRLLGHDLFVGRADELRALGSAAQAARRGGGLVLVTGEAGAGKSALLGRFAGRLREEGWTVVVGRCPEHEGAPPAWAWAEALGTLARLAPPSRPAEVAALLHDPNGTPATARHEAGVAALPPRDETGVGAPPNGPDGTPATHGNETIATTPGDPQGTAATPRNKGALPHEPTTPPGSDATVAALLRDPDGRAATTRDEATAGRFRLHRAFAGWLREAAGSGPVAVLLEDLHRADGQTLALLEAAAAITGVPLLTVACYRPAEVGEPLAKTLAHLAPLLPHRIALAGLSPRDVATVVDAVCGGPVDEATVAALAARTGGNPFYVRESARLLADEGALVAVSEVPQGVRDVLRRRLALLSADARAAVQLAAVAGPESDVALLVDAAEADEERVLAGLDAAVAADLLTDPVPGRVRFVHALVRDTVYTDLSGIRRARLHDRIAQRLRTHRPDDLAALAHHFARSGRTANAPLAVDYALRAAELAERRYAHDVAVGLVRQALEAHTAVTAGPEDRPDGTVALLVRLLGAQVRAGATGAARLTRRQAVDLAVRAGRDDLAAAVYGAWTEPSPWRSRLEGFLDRTSLAHLERLAEDRTLDGPTRARVLQVLAEAVAGEDARRARDAARTQLELARSDGEPRLLASALMTSAGLLPHETQGVVRTPLVDELRDLALDHDLPAHRWVCEHLDALTAATRNDPDAVRRHTAAGLELAHHYRMRWARGINTATSAMLAAAAGRFEEAEARYTEADGLFQRVGAHHATAPRTLGLWTIRLAQRREAELEPAVREVYESVGTPVAVAHALVLARLGRLDEAAAVPFPARPVTDHLYGIELDYRAELAVLLEDRDTARSLIGALLPLKEQFAGVAGGAYATRPLAHALGDLYRLAGERGLAAEAYALAERVARIWGSPHHAAAAGEALADLRRG